MPTIPKRATKRRAPQRSTLHDAERDLDQVRYEVARLQYAAQHDQRNPLGSSKRHIDFSLAEVELGRRLTQAGERLAMAETAALVRYAHGRSKRR
jgi:hypothetical protein